MTIKLHPCPVCRAITSDVRGTICRRCQQQPPAFGGGQGRHPRDIEGDGIVGIVIAVLLSAIVWFTVIVRCS
jgi:hypothetical protein